MLGRRSPRAARRTPMVVAAAALASLALIGAGCGSSGVGSGDSTTPSSAPTQSLSEPNATGRSSADSVATSDPAPTSTPAESSTGDGSFRMPNEVGQVLQNAQDDIQKVSGDPVFVSHSHDLLGSRYQILDSDWKVCTQNVDPGAKASAIEHIDFGVVKTDETCP